MIYKYLYFILVVTTCVVETGVPKFKKMEYFGDFNYLVIFAVNHQLKCVGTLVGTSSVVTSCSCMLSSQMHLKKYAVLLGDPNLESMEKRTIQSVHRNCDKKGVVLVQFNQEIGENGSPIKLDGRDVGDKLKYQDCKVPFYIIAEGQPYQAKYALVGAYIKPVQSTVASYYEGPHGQFACPNHGSPLVCENTLIGIIEPDKCHPSFKSSSFTAVNLYKSWIEENSLFCQQKLNTSAIRSKSNKIRCNTTNYLITIYLLCLRYILY